MIRIVTKVGRYNKKDSGEEMVVLHTVNPADGDCKPVFLSYTKYHKLLNGEELVLDKSYNINGASVDMEFNQGGFLENLRQLAKK